MSLHRVILAAIAALFTVGMTSLASADCCGGYSGCGGCGAPAPVAYAAVMPVAPAPIGVAVAVTPFGGPCCS